MKLWMSNTVVRAILVHQVKALDLTLIEYHCLNKHYELLKVCKKISGFMI